MKKQFEVVKPTPPASPDWTWQINTRFDLCEVRKELLHVPGLASNTIPSGLPGYTACFMVGKLFTASEVRKSVLSVLEAHCEKITTQAETP